MDDQAQQPRHMDGNTDEMGRLDSPAERSAPPIDTGLSCLVMLARYHQVAAEPAQLAHEC